MASRNRNSRKTAMIENELKYEAVQAFKRCFFIFSACYGAKIVICVLGPSNS
jgi:hypothetical protein